MPFVDGSLDGDFGLLWRRIEENTREKRWKSRAGVKSLDLNTVSALCLSHTNSMHGNEGGGSGRITSQLGFEQDSTLIECHEFQMSLFGGSEL